ncbi:MAG: hypothetical protein C0508_10985, partial [Cyanobacteria bacterium PR.023]|nr:hypothetical protein [Cyanobacteria bacterium PR.023]
MFLDVISASVFYLATSFFELLLSLACFCLNSVGSFEWLFRSTNSHLFKITTMNAVIALGRMLYSFSNICCHERNQDTISHFPASQVKKLLKCGFSIESWLRSSR